jgi:hypothetical protein
MYGVNCVCALFQVNILSLLEFEAFAELFGIFWYHLEYAAEWERMPTVAVLDAVHFNATVVDAHTEIRNITIHRVLVKN